MPRLHSPIGKRQTRRDLFSTDKKKRGLDALGRGGGTGERAGRSARLATRTPKEQVPKLSTREQTDIRLREELAAATDETERNLLERLLSKVGDRSLEAEALRSHRLMRSQLAGEREFLDKRVGDLRGIFARQMELAGAGELARATRAAELTAGRRGLAFTGMEQAAMAGVRGEFATARYQTIADFESDLAQLQFNYEAAWRRGYFDLFASLAQKARDFEYDKYLLQFQMALADKYRESGWGDVFGAIGQMAGLGLAIWQPWTAPATAGTSMLGQAPDYGIG